MKTDDVVAHVQIEVVSDEGVQLPSYATVGSAGMDIVSNIDIIIEPFTTALIPTGLRVSIPMGFELQIRPRSGLSASTGIRVANSPGTIDSDYRGEIKVILENTKSIAFGIRKGDRIAQAILCPYFKVKWESVESLDQTERGEGGFGSTGVNTA